MGCKRCGSEDLWDDNLSWGCNRCGWASINGRSSFVFAKEAEHLPATNEEIPRYRDVWRVVRTDDE